MSNLFNNSKITIMKNKILIFGLFSAISISGILYSTTRNSSMSFLIMDDIEALAGCEVSSDASKNTGYCTTVKGSNEDVCANSGSGAEVRCSGNY